jgi:hypothetical protein
MTQSASRVFLKKTFFHFSFKELLGQAPQDNIGAFIAQARE